MSALNALLRAIFDALQYPLRGLSPFWGVLIWSIPVSVFALLVFKWTSSQDRISAVKKKIHACLFEIRLFNDDLGAILRAQVEIFRHVVTYQRLSLVPMLYILPPLLLLMVHLHTYYGYRGFQPEDRALLKVQLIEDWSAHDSVAGNPARPPIELELSDGLSAETPAVWMESINEVAWRLVVDDWGDHELAVKLGSATYSKTVSATEQQVRLSYERPDRDFINQLEWPGEEPLPAGSPIRSITLTYPAGSIGLLGFDFEWEFAWMVVFFVLTMVIAFALRKRLGVEF